MPDVDGMHICIFESLRLEGSYVGDLLYLVYQFKQSEGMKKNHLWNRKTQMSIHLVSFVKFAQIPNIKVSPNVYVVIRV